MSDIEYERQDNKKKSSDIKIYVDDLRIGMFVSGLDRDWLDTPYLVQGFYIYTVEDIQKLRQYCEWVYVHSDTTPPSIEGSVDFDSGDLIGRKPQKYTLTEDIKKELSNAKKITREVRGFAKSFLKDARLGQAVDSKTARGFVDSSVESILRHPNAMGWMTKMRGVDEYTTEHCLNVCFLAIIFGRRLGLKKNQLSNLGLCGLLHDVGKMRVPPEVLNKPGKFTPEELQEMRSHVEHGRKLLEMDRNIYQGAIEVAHRHHERVDGKGYPEGVDDSELSLFTKIISIVDVYDAVTGDRVYSKGKSSAEALRIIYEGRGKQFDEKLALAFIQTIGLYPPGCMVELMNGEIGLVLESEDRLRHLPNVLIILAADKKTRIEKVVCLEGTMDGSLSKEYLIKTSLPDGSYGIRLRDFYNQNIFLPQ